MSRRRDHKKRVLRSGESQRKDGRYEYKFTDTDGIRKSVYSWRLVETDSIPVGKSDGDALRTQERQIQKKLQENLIALPQSVCLNDLFMTHMEISQMENSTRENYFYMWERFVKNALGKREAISIKKSTVKRFYASCKKNGLADGSIQGLHKMIHPSLQIAVEDGIIGKNPSDGCCADYRKPAREKEALTLEQERAFLEYLKKFGGMRTKQRYNLLFRVMLGTSCRIGEIIGLTWDNVDLKNRMIYIDHAILYRKKDGKMQFYASKTKSESGVRSIPMTQDVYECMRKLNEERFLHPSVCEIDGYKNFVFTSGKGNPLYPQNINKALYRIVECYNQEHEEPLPRISSHIFRHTGCTRMAEAGVDIKTMQQVMGIVIRR